MSSQQVFDILWRDAIYAQFTGSAVALFILDYFLILPREVALVWQKKIGFGSALYFMARFTLGISVVIFSCVRVGIFSHYNTCLGFLRVSGATFLVSQLSMQTILIIRAYAISNQNRYILALLTGLTIGSVIPAFTETATVTCNASLGKNQILDTILSTLLIAIFDIVLIVVTLYHTLGLRRLQVGSRSDKKSLTSMLMQQGLVRFLFSLTVTVTLIVPNQVLASGFNNILLYHGLIIQNALLSRFFLDLRWLSCHPNGTTFTKAAQRSQSQSHWVLSLTFQAAAHSQWTSDSVVAELERGLGGCEPAPGHSSKETPSHDLE